MRKIFTQVLVMAALLVAGAAFVSCDKENTHGVYTMTVNATMGDNGAKQLGLSADGHTLNATWAVGEQVTVYNVTKNADLEGSLVAQSAGATTTLSGTLNGDIEAGDVLKLEFLSPDYNNQEGTIEYIAENCDYATATVTVASVNNSQINANATFENQQAIIKFTLLDKGTDAAINATQLVVGDGTNSYTVSPEDATHVLYVAIPATNTVNLTATVGSDIYTYAKTDAGLTAGQYYEITVGMTIDLLSTPLTLKVLSEGTIKVNSPKSGMQYSLNGGEKQAVTPNAITVAVGDKVAFYGYSTRYFGTRIAGGTAQVKVYGNIMSLVNENNYATATELTTESAFRSLFQAYYNLTDASELMLPATTLTPYCYTQMFQSCTTLTAAPALPATTLDIQCYSGMFQACTTLTAAPVLPATTLAQNCYYRMFYECSNLTTAPVLPATTLASNCYSQMFYNCSNLTTAPVLPATTLVYSCYYRMFYQCSRLNSVTCLATNPSTTYTEDWLNSVASSGTFTTPSSTNWGSGASGIPSGWTRENSD